MENVRSFLASFKGKSPYTYANALKALKVFFRDFLKRSHVVASFRFSHIGIALKRVPSKAELKRFYNALPDLKSRAMFLLFATSGLRLSELLKLKLTDLDLTRG